MNELGNVDAKNGTKWGWAKGEAGSGGGWEGTAGVRERRDGVSCCRDGCLVALEARDDINNNVRAYAPPHIIT